MLVPRLGSVTTPFSVSTCQTSDCSSAWTERSVWDREVEGSNPSSQTSQTSGKVVIVD